MVVQSYLAPRCHTRGQLVLGGTAFADTVTVDADDRAHRHRGEHRARPSPGHLGVRSRRHVGGADEPHQSENSSASPMTETPGFIVIQRGSQHPVAGMWRKHPHPLPTGARFSSPTRPHQPGLRPFTCTPHSIFRKSLKTWRAGDQNYRRGIGSKVSKSTGPCTPSPRHRHRHRPLESATSVRIQPRGRSAEGQSSGPGRILTLALVLASTSVGSEIPLQQLVSVIDSFQSDPFRLAASPARVPHRQKFKSSNLRTCYSAAYNSHLRDGPSSEDAEL